METTRIQNGQTERIEVLALDSSGNPLTGLSDVLLGIRRISDGFWLDFNDGVFKNSGWTTRQQVMTQIDATNDAGKYKYDFVTTGFADDTYELRSDCASADNFPQTGELKVGDYVDNLDASVNAVKTKTDNLPADPASETNVDANETKIDTVQTDVTAIKAKTDNHPTDLDSEITFLKGLSGVNAVLDDFTYDGSNKATAGTLYVYDTKANAQTHSKTAAGGLLFKVAGVAVITGGNTTKLTRTQETVS